MKETVKALEKKVKKHEEKLEAHDSSLNVLITEYDYLEGKGYRDLDSLEMKIMSTIKNIEYHTGSCKAYRKAIDIVKLKA